MIYLDFDEQCNAVFAVDSVLMNIQQFAKWICETEHTNPGRAQNLSGVEHPAFYNVARGRSKALVPVLMVAVSYGIEISLGTMS